MDKSAKEKIKSEMSNHLRKKINEMGITHLDLNVILINAFHTLVENMGIEKYTDLLTEIGKQNPLHDLALSSATKIALELFYSLLEKANTIPGINEVYTPKDIVKMMGEE